MKKDTSGILKGITGQDFIQDEKVIVRRLGDGGEYRAKISGVGIDHDVKVMICEIVDAFKEDYPFSHCAIPEVCIDKEAW